MTAKNRWSAELKQHLPEARVVGVLADGNGFLVICPGKHDSCNVQRIHDNLKKVGVVGWNWDVGERGMTIRAYLPPRRRYRWTHTVVLAIFIAALRVVYDIHASGQTHGE